MNILSNFLIMTGTLTNRVENATQEIEQTASIYQQVKCSDANTMVDTGCGHVPSLRKVLKDLGGYTYKGEWVANTKYQAKDQVQHDRIVWLCLSAHTSGDTFLNDVNSGFWSVWQAIATSAETSYLTIDDAISSNLDQINRIHIIERGNAPFEKIESDKAVSYPALTKFQDGSGQWWCIADEQAAQIEWFGAKGDVDGAEGTNDLEAFQAACEWMHIKAGVTPQPYSGHPKVGRVLELGAKSYGVCVTEAQFDTGMKSAIPLPSKCGIRGQGMEQTQIIALNGHSGHIIANRTFGRSSKDEKMYVQHLSIYGRRWEYTHSDENHDKSDIGRGKYAGDGIRFEWGGSGFENVDNWSGIYGVKVSNAKAYGLYISGRGECNITECYFGQSLIGVYAHLVDSVFTRVNAGGNRFTGFQVMGTACRFISCKSFYNGVEGESDYTKCCNWHIYGNSWAKGTNAFLACESQESRGSGFVIEGGTNSFTECIAGDPAREALAGGALPSVISHYHLTGATGGWDATSASYNMFTNCKAYPALTRNYSDPNHTPVKSPASAVYMDTLVKGCAGDIYLYPQTEYPEFAVMGVGALSGNNKYLRVGNQPLIGNEVYKTPYVYMQPADKGINVTINNHANPYDVVAYKAKMTSSEGAVERIFITSGDSIFIDKLTNGVEYSVQISTVSIIGQSEFTAAQLITPSAERYYYISDGSSKTGWITNKRMVNLDLSKNVLEFRVRNFDIPNNMGYKQFTLFEQKAGSSIELRISVTGKFNLRIELGGKADSGSGGGAHVVNMGIGKEFNDNDWKIIIGNGMVLMISNGIEYGRSFYSQIGPERSTTQGLQIGYTDDSHVNFIPYTGGIGNLKVNGVFLPLDDHTSSVQQAVLGDTSVKATAYNYNVGLWQKIV